jgi:hypothetical protein
VPRFENKIIFVDLPDDWVDASDEEVVAFANPSRAEQLIVSFGEIKQHVEATQVSDIIWDLIQYKAKAMVEQGRSNIQILEATRTPPNLPCRAEFSAFDERNAVYAKVIVAGHANHFFSLSYYRLKCAQVTLDAQARAGAILGMCSDKAAP